MRREVIAEGTNPSGSKYVLCFFKRNFRIEFVTWLIGKRNNYCLGNYFSNLKEAVRDLEERIDFGNGGEIDWNIPARWNEAQVTLFFELELEKDNSLKGGESGVINQR